MEGRLAPEAPNKDPVELKVLSVSEQGLVCFSFSFSLPLSFSVLSISVCVYVYIYIYIHISICRNLTDVCVAVGACMCVYVCKRFI